MAWMALAAAAVGAYSSRESRQSAEDASENQGEASDRQMDLAERQFNLGEDQYNMWLENFFPLAQESIRIAQQDVQPDYARIAADNAGSFNAQRGGMVRAAQRYGMNPHDGAYGNALSKLHGAEAKSLVYTRNRAREDAKGQKLKNMTAVYGMGSGMPSLAAGAFGSASTGAGNASIGYGQMAQIAGQNAANEAAGYGNAIGSIPWSQLWSGVSGGGTAATSSGSVGPTAGGYSYPAAAGGTPGPWAGANGAYTSSRESKDNITEVDPNDALDIVNNTPVRGYNYKNDPGTHYVGTIAEEAPGAISNGKQVNLINQVGTLTGAVQALSKQMGGAKSKRYGMDGASATTVPYTMKNRNANAATAQAGGRRNFGTRVMDRIVPDRNGDGRRGGGDWAAAAGNAVANYATGGMYGLVRRGVNAVRNRGGRRSTSYDHTPASEPNNPYQPGQPWAVPNYDGPPTNFAQPGRAPMQQPWSMPDYLADPGQRSLTPAELRQQQGQFDRFQNDPNSIYYQGGSARDPMPEQYAGPVSRGHRSPTRDLFNAYDVRTGSGDGFNASRDHYRSLMAPRRDIRE